MTVFLRDAARAEYTSRAVQNAKNATREATKQETSDEVNFLFKLNNRGTSQMLSFGRQEAEMALVTAASFNYASTVRKLVELGVNVSARLGHRRETALHFAASAGDESLVRFLCSKGALLDSPDNHRRVPLHCAAWLGHHDSVRTLLSHDAEINAQDEAGRTALFGAAGGGYLDTVRILLGRGADPNIRGGTLRQTALERADSRGFTEVARELRVRTSSSLVQTTTE